MTMQIKSYVDFQFKVDDGEPLFVIGVVSRVVKLPIWTLRRLDDMGVVSPKRIGHKTRCYSQNQIKKLTYISYLMENRRINVNGIKFILEKENILE